MEPKQSAPNLSPERAPSPSYEAAPGFGVENGQSIDRRHNKYESDPNNNEQPRGEHNSTVLPPPVLPAPPVTDDGVAVQQSTPADDLPLVANDDDLIEKEWVDKAKKIIADTKDDPYRREMEVNRLQADYLKKRYGKQLGKVE